MSVIVTVIVQWPMEYFVLRVEPYCTFQAMKIFFFKFIIPQSYRRIFVYIFCLISMRALVSNWEIRWSTVNNDRVLNDKFCQKIWVHYIRCILRNACLKTRIFTANIWLINYFATQLFCVFLKTNIFSKTERKKLKIFW